MNVMGRSTHARRAVLRCSHDGDGRRSGALFGARLRAIGRTHSTGCRARFCVLCGQLRRHRLTVLPWSSVQGPRITRVTPELGPEYVHVFRG